ncbi:MAG: CbiQ family ECF transporter T component, partial [Coriobacteriales bacterium]|nr:CbiQ family ECF transporter T component [Coriobacteriales bacterium]
VSYMGKDVCVGDIGMSLQRPEDQLFCDTVLEDVMYGPLNRGLSPEQALERAHQSLELLGVSRELWDRHPQYLSGGERRRVALAGIVALDVETYIFDEPTAGLDGDGRKALRGVVRKLAQQGKTVVVISHDVDEWLSTADYLVIMAHGCLTYVGPVSRALGSAEPFVHADIIPPRAVREASAKRGEKPDELSEDLAFFDVVEPRPTRITPLQRIPAGVHILIVLALTVALFATKSLALIAAVLGTTLVCCGIARVRVREVANLMGAVSIVLAFALVANTFVLDGSGEIPLVGPLGITSAGASRGLIAILRIITLLLMALVAAHSTTSSAIARALIAPLRPLQHLGVPIDRLRITVMLALRCLPQAIAEFKNVEAAQLVRKTPLRTGSIRKRLASWTSVLVPTVVSLMRRANELGIALHDRGY